MKKSKSVKVLLSIDSKLLKDVDRIVKNENFNSRSEFLRHLFKLYVANLGAMKS